MAKKEDAIYAKLQYINLLGGDPHKYGIIGVGISGDKGNYHVRIMYNHPDVEQHLPKEYFGVKFVSQYISTPIRPL